MSKLEHFSDASLQNYITRREKELEHADGDRRAKLVRHLGEAWAEQERRLADLKVSAPKTKKGAAK
jgi:hypothetical protein